MTKEVCALTKIRLLFVRALAGYQKDKDQGCEGMDRLRHGASKGQHLEAARYRGVPITVSFKDRLEMAVGPSVTSVAVWKVKRPHLVGR